MSRLSKNIREALIRRLVERTFQKKVQDHIDACVKFADDLYKDAMAPHLRTMKTIPDNGLPTDGDIKVSLGGEVQSIRFHGTLTDWSVGSWFSRAGAKLNDSTHRAFPACFKGKVLKVYEGNHPLVDRFRTLQGEKKDLGEEISKAHHSGMAAMEKVSTVKKLIEIWPELEAFAKPYLTDGERRATAPVIRREELNEVFSLPPLEAVS